jgi:hypothetical protein
MQWSKSSYIKIIIIIIIIVVYLTMFQYQDYTASDGKFVWWTKKNLEEVVLVQLGYYPGICLKELNKTAEDLIQDSRCLGREQPGASYRVSMNTKKEHTHKHSDRSKQKANKQEKG